MSDLYAVADCKIYIGGVVASQTDDFDASDFSAETWVEIDGWTTMGTVGDSKALITTSVINRGRDVKQGGTKNAGSMENTFAILPTDAGQIALKAAAQTNDNYAFKIEYNDMASGGSTNSTDLFIGLVLTAPKTGGDANTIQALSSTIEINSNIVEVAAT